MFTPLRLLMTFIPPLLLWIGACIVMFGHIEADLAERTLAAVEQSGALDRPAVAVRGRDVTLTGNAIGPQGQNSAIDAAVDTFGVRLVADRIAPLPTVKRQAFAAIRESKSLVPAGSMPQSPAPALSVPREVVATPDGAGKTR